MTIWRIHYHRELDGIHAFYANGMMRSLVLALIGIFTPVFLYKLGFGYGGSLVGVVMVALYFVLVRVTTLLTVIPIAQIIEKIGFRKSILISAILLSLNLIMMILSQDNIFLVIPAAIVSGLNIPFYWVARNSAISQDGSAKKVGTQMGWMTTLEQIATMLGPLAAGLVIESWGFTTLFVGSLVLLLFSVVPLWSMNPHVHKNGATIKGFWYFVTNRRYFHIAVGVGARSVDDYTMGVLWPLSIFILGIRTSVMGGLFTLVSLLCLVIRMIVSKGFDRMHKRGDWSDEIVFTISALFSSALWVVRLFIGTLGSILAVDLTGAIFGTAYSTMYVDYEQLGGMRMGSIAYWVYGEMMYSIMTIGLMGMVAVGAHYGVWRELAFLSASFWLIISIMMARESNLKG